MTWSRGIVWAAIAVGLSVATGCGGDYRVEEWPGEPGKPRAEIIIDMVKAHYGRVPVTMRVTGVDGTKNYEFHDKASNNEYTYHDASFVDGEGRPIRSKRRGNSYRLEPFEGDVVEATWEAEPGGLGRHGMQGAVVKDFATFDGRLFLMPRDIGRLVAVRIHFVLPWGWEAVTPFRKEGEWYYLDSFGPRDVRLLMEKSCMGVGHFDVETRQIGEMELRIANYSGWDDAYKAKITDSTLKIVGYFNETFGFDLKSPYLALWTPRVNRYRVHGGSSINGTCLQNPDNELRSFQLLAHRLAHSMNKYPPATIKVGDPNGRWFREGWASYMEVTATEATGVATEQSYYNSLYLVYKTRLKREMDLALSREPAASDEGVIEFLHYTKGPLVVKMLADQVRARTGRSLEEFMRTIWTDHGWLRDRFSLKQELEAFGGTTFDDFWQAMIYPEGIVIPAWDHGRHAGRDETPAGGARRRPAGFRRIPASSGSGRRFRVV